MSQRGHLVPWASILAILKSPKEIFSVRFCLPGGGLKQKETSLDLRLRLSRLVQASCLHTKRTGAERLLILPDPSESRWRN